MTPTTSSAAHQLADLIASAKSFAFLTGAGISTASGLPDFRSNDGLWKKYDPQYAGSLTGFRKDPALVWSYYVDRLQLANPKPNAAHEAVAALSRHENCLGIITQNVDGLHEQTSPAAELITIHGTLTQANCLACDTVVPMETALELRRQNGGTWPPCPSCGDKPLKPAVIMFEELLRPEDTSRAEFIASEVDLLIALGTSLEVWPVSQLPEIVLSKGRGVAIVTAGDTPYDHRGIAFRSRLQLDHFLPHVVTALAGR